MPTLPNKSIVDDNLFVDIRLSWGRMDSMNRYVIQCEKLKLSPLQAISALEQLEAIVSKEDRGLVLDAMNYFSARTGDITV
jgi:hypothetical protein